MYVQELIEVMLKYDGYCFAWLMQRRKTSLILNASKYIRGLRQKLQELNQLAAAAAQNVIDNGPAPVVCMI